MAVEGDHEIVRTPSLSFRWAILDGSKAAQADPLRIAEMRYQTGEGVRPAQPDILPPKGLQPEPHCHQPAVEQRTARHSSCIQHVGLALAAEAGSEVIAGHRSEYQGNDRRDDHSLDFHRPALLKHHRADDQIDQRQQ